MSMFIRLMIMMLGCKQFILCDAEKAMCVCADSVSVTVTDDGKTKSYGSIVDLDSDHVAIECEQKIVTNKEDKVER